jgi:hypothetical protein
MDAELAAFDTEWKTGDRASARKMAEDYATAHPELSTRYGTLGIPELVKRIDEARAQRDEDTRVEIDLWLLAAFEPQTIGGSANIGGTRKRG